VLFGFLLLLAIGMPLVGVLALLSGDAEGLFVLAFSPLLGMAVVMGYLGRLRGRDRGTGSLRLRRLGELNQIGVELAYSGALALGYLVITVFGVVLFGSVSLLALWVLVDGGFSLGALVWMTGAGAGALYMLRFCLHVLRGKLARGAVVLTPQGVFHRSWAFESYFRWDCAMFVDAAQLDGPLVELAVTGDQASWFRRTSGLWEQEELLYQPHLAVRVMWLAVDPALLYHALRFYQQNAALRAELGDERGLQRLRTGDLLIEGGRDEDVR
jgi:hypothetical protein